MHWPLLSRVEARISPVLSFHFSVTLTSQPSAPWGRALLALFAAAPLLRSLPILPCQGMIMSSLSAAWVWAESGTKRARCCYYGMEAAIAIGGGDGKGRCLSGKGFGINGRNGHDVMVSLWHTHSWSHWGVFGRLVWAQVRWSRRARAGGEGGQ